MQKLPRLKKITDNKKLTSYIENNIILSSDQPVCLFYTNDIGNNASQIWLCKMFICCTSTKGHVIKFEKSRVPYPSLEYLQIGVHQLHNKETFSVMIQDLQIRNTIVK